MSNICEVLGTVPCYHHGRPFCDNKAINPPLDLNQFEWVVLVTKRDLIQAKVLE
jgi:hypothetical protein